MQESPIEKLKFAGSIAFSASMFALVAITIFSAVKSSDRQSALAEARAKDDERTAISTAWAFASKTHRLPIMDDIRNPQATVPESYFRKFFLVEIDYRNGDRSSLLVERSGYGEGDWSVAPLTAEAQKKLDKARADDYADEHQGDAPEGVRAR